MSKAFTRESDDEPDDLVALPQRPPLPPGARNYITPRGLDRLRAEIDRLIKEERPKAAADPDETSARRQIKIIDHRIRQLNDGLETAVPVPPPDDPDTVRFGATVLVRDSKGNELDYRIVGIDETDLDRGWVSWLSPIAKSLLNARLGQRVRFAFPDGEEELEIRRIQYE